MPELPEVETIKRQLEERIVGKSIMEIEVRNEKSFVGKRLEVKGKKIVGVSRRAKMMIWELERTNNVKQIASLRLASLAQGKLSRNDRMFLVFRLGMSGQILYTNSKLKVKNEKLQLKVKSGINSLNDDKHVRVIFYLSDGSKVYFRDVRKFGRIRVLGDLGDLGNLGEEPLNKNFTKEYLREILQKSKKAIKVFLMEQGRIAGIGNIYANEALFEAGILPTRPSNSLSPKETEKLYNSIRKVLSEGVEHQGSSIKDKSYINALGEIGIHQHHLKVYQRDGLECLVCGGVIKRTVVGQRGTYFCERCQK